MCVGSVCTHPFYIDRNSSSVYFFISILKSPFSNQAVLRFLSEWRSSVQPQSPPPPPPPPHDSWLTKLSYLKVRSHQTRMKRINCAIRTKLDAWTFWVYSLHLRVKFAPFTTWIRHSYSIHYTYASWEGLLPGSSSLVTKCIPVFVKVWRCIYSSGYPHTTTITLSSIVVSDFLPPLVMTSLLEQAPDWFTRRKYPPKFRFFNSRYLHE